MDELDRAMGEFLNDRSQWNHLNELAALHHARGRHLLAFICATESLRLNAKQPEVLSMAEEFRKLSRPHFPTALRPVTCTVSVIMPTYNRGEEVRESISSVLNQTFSDLELIIVNDGGTNAVKAITDAFDSPRVRYHRLPYNRGLSTALNEGIQIASGKYIAYLDDDDVFYPRHIQMLVEAAEKHPDYPLVYSNAWWCTGRLVGAQFIEEGRRVYERRPVVYDKYLLLDENYISTLNVLHTRDALSKTGLFNEGLPYLMDWDLWLRFAEHAPLFQLNELTGEYRWTDNNMSLRHGVGMKCIGYLLSRYYEFLKGKVGLLKAYLALDRKKESEQIVDEIAREYRCPFMTHNLIREVLDSIRAFRGRRRFEVGAKLLLESCKLRAREMLPYLL